MWKLPRRSPAPSQPILCSSEEQKMCEALCSPKSPSIHSESLNNNNNNNKKRSLSEIEDDCVIFIHQDKEVDVVVLKSPPNKKQRLNKDENDEREETALKMSRFKKSRISTQAGRLPYDMSVTFFVNHPLDVIFDAEHKNQY